MEGLEPPRLAALEPKSSASPNFATPAYVVLIEELTLLYHKTTNKLIVLMCTTLSSDFLLHEAKELANT